MVKQPGDKTARAKTRVVPQRHAKEGRYPLDVLLISGHGHADASTAYGLHKFLSCSPAVRAYGITKKKVEAMTFVRAGKVNTIFINPCLPGDHFWSDTHAVMPKNFSLRKYDMEPFISRMREDHPNVVFVLYTDKDCLERFCNRHPRFRNYFHLPEIIIPGTFGYRPKKTAPEVFSLEPAVDAILRRCEEWHHTRYEYDVCLSFAGEDRQVAQKLANRLTRYGHRVFYDRYEEAELIGKNLYTHLHEVYSAKSRYCVILVSAAYANKIWTSHERTAAQDRALNERGREYVIPIRLDNTPIQGLPSTIGYAKIDKGIKYISDLIDQKLVLREARKKGHLGRALY